MPQPSYTLPQGKNPDLTDISRALIIVAHPDDIDYGCAGTVAVLTAKNINVTYCLVTSGEAGGDSDSLSANERKSMREEEQTRAANVVGVNKLHFLRQPDGRIEANFDLREKITRVIRKEKPDLVITQSPQRRYDRIFASHPDHLATGEATVCACYPDSQNPHAYPHLLDESLEPHAVKAMWLMADPSPDVFVDITDVFERKIEALWCHESQIPDRGENRAFLEEWSSHQGHIAGFGQGHFAESFRFIQIMQ